MKTLSSAVSLFSRRAALLGCIALLVASGAFAAGEVNGHITGYVYDPTGAALAEVPLTLQGSLLQGTQTRTTGDDGRFEFSLVPPGTDYVIEVNVPGFAPIRQTGIKVYVGQNTPVDVHLAVMTETQAVATYEIVEKINPIINPDSAQTGAVVTAEKAAITPIFHQVEGMPRQVAGVSDSNFPSTRGGLARWGKFYVDGMDTTDVTVGGITAPMNFDSVEQFEIITGGFDAQYNALGMVENAVTKSGSNRWTYDVTMTLQPPFLAATNFIPPNQVDAVGVFTNNPAPAPQTSFYSPIINFGGPIIKDRLWFYASTQLNLSNRGVSIITPVSPLENRNVYTQTRLARLKVTWQATSQDRVSVAFHYDHNHIDNNTGNSSVTDNAESRIDRGGFFLIGNYDHNFTDNILFQLQTGFTSKQSNFDPQIGDTEDASHFDKLLNITQFSSGALGGTAGAANFQHETKSRFQFDPTLTWKLGAHQMKAGIQFSYLGDINRLGVTGGTRFTDQGGVCNPSDPTTFAFCSQRAQFFNTDGTMNDVGAPLINTSSAQTFGTFIQDRWNVSRQLTLVPGIRLDVGHLYGTDATGKSFLATTPLVGVGPRLSATYDATNDRKNLVVFHYGRSNDVGDAGLAQFANPALTQITENFGGGAFPSCSPNSLTPACQLSGGATGRFLRPGQRPPHVDEVMLGLHHANNSETVFGIDLTYRRYSDMWAGEEINRVFDASGTKVIGYVNGVNQSILQGEAAPGAFRDYKGMDLWVQGTPGKWDLLASYTLSYAQGTVSDFFDGYLQNPRLTQFYYGYVPDDQRHALKGSIAYKTGYNFDVGMRFRYITGKPLWENFFNGATPGVNYYRSPRGTGFANNPATGLPNFNDPTTETELRNPSAMTIDLQGRYDVGTALNLPFKAEFILLVVDALNNYDPAAIVDTYSTRGNRFGTAVFHNGPLQAEVYLRIRN